MQMLQKKEKNTILSQRKYLGFFFVCFYTGGVRVFTSRHCQHKPLQTVSQERSTKQTVQPRTLCQLPDEHHRHTAYGQDRPGLQLGRGGASLVEKQKYIKCKFSQYYIKTLF